MLTTVLKFGFNVRFDIYKYKSEIVPKKLILHVFERRNLENNLEKLSFPWVLRASGSR